MVWRAAVDGRCTYCSPAWLRFTGRSSSQELNEGWLENMHEEDRAASISEFQRAVEGRRGYTSLFRARRADGVFRLIVTTGAPRLGLHGEVEEFEGACVDITDQLHAGGHLTLLELHADYTSEVVYRVRVHPTREMEYMSASVLRLTGRKPEEYYELYRHPERALHLFAAEDRDRAAAIIAQPEAQPAMFLLRWIHADGRTLWIEHQRTPVRDEDGRVVAIVGVARDVSRQKMLERQEHQHAALLGALVDHFDATLVESPDGQTLLANAAFALLFGGSVAGGQPREPSRDSARTRQIRERGEPCGERIAWPDGRVLHRDYVPVRADEALVAHMWRYVDVTAMVRSEEAWLESRHRLRDLALHAEAVRETERRQLARMLHDDLGQTFTSIRLELVSAIVRFRDTATPEQLDLVDRLQNAAGLIDISLATLRRISTSLRPPVLDHLGLVAGIQLEAAAFERRSGIRCRVSALPKELDMDRDRSTAVYRILLEALSNVARHSKAGAVRIALLRRPGALLLKVEDNGRGIRPEEAANPRTMGLLGMRERSLPFGGDVRVTPGPRGGTRVLAILPL
jgi:PAS domain S-box-containing protein